MKPKENNYAFIDSQNVNLSIRWQGWILNWSKFRRYLKEKYQVEKAYLFIGYVPGNQPLYSSLQQAGFIVIFKPTLLDHTYKVVKGNCDAELVLHSMIEYNNYDKAIVVSNDGDFYCLVEYLVDHGKLCRLMIPDRTRYSSLLRKFVTFIAYMNDLKFKLQYNKKRL